MDSPSDCPLATFPNFLVLLLKSVGRTLLLPHPCHLGHWIHHYFSLYQERISKYSLSSLKIHWQTSLLVFIGLTSSELPQDVDADEGDENVGGEKCLV